MKSVAADARPERGRFRMTTSLLRIYGRVHGVGFRAGLAGEAARRGVAGWVRNRRDGSVEALLRGEAGAVEALTAWCRRGPPAAEVERVAVEPAPGEALAAGAGFEQRPTL
jgi:acylphosphatase